MIWKFPTYETGQPIDWLEIEARFSWFRDMKGVPQDKIWHAEGDVFIHTKMVVEALVSLPEYKKLQEQEQHILFTAALMHDIEKRSTTAIEMIQGKERIVSPRHAKKGELTARSVLYRNLPTPFAIRENIAKLVRLHGLPLWAISKSNSRKKVIDASLYVNTEHLAMLAKADVLGRTVVDKEDMLFRIELFRELCMEHDCWAKPKTFASDYGRFLFLTKSETAPDYKPYDDLKFNVIVMCALPGSGKDTYVEQNLNLPILSLDDIRRKHKIDPTDKKGNGQAIQLGKERAKELMRARTDFVFNATNLTKDMRGRWVSLFTEYGARIKLVYLEVPYKKLLVQNKKRKYKVPEDIIDKLISKLEMPGYDEGHELEFVVREK